MSDLSTKESHRISLPLASLGEQKQASPEWHGWTPIGLPEAAYAEAAAAPEPIEPQGAYCDNTQTPLLVPAVEKTTDHPVELLAPAGGLEAAFAALHFGADAIYLGLKKFSARAEAENFSFEEVDEITAYAHALTPPRRVLAAVNTVIRQDELDELIEAVATLADIGVDALLVQDLGVYHLVHHYFPHLAMHASTQLAVHNRAGVAALQRLGFRRVVLARELTFEEVRDITALEGIETEVFIHGALCYAYSGLCLFSSQTLGRSGNRGRCAYSCRDAFEVTGAPLTLRDGSTVQRDPRQGFPFSMKDLALPDHLPALRDAGVSSFKIEGRKKSPLYVATTTDYYRRLLDGRLSTEERPAVEADLQTVFSRPWTRLFVQSHKDKEVADRDTVGHRGTAIGQVEGVLTGGGEPRLRFRTRRALEKHDGLQIDLPILGKPFGFAVERLWVLGPRGKRLDVFEAPAGSLVEVTLPREHPELPPGAPVYCASSQAVKNHYRYERPRPQLYRVRFPIQVELVLTADTLTATGRILPRHPGERLLEAASSLAGAFSPARDPTAMAETAKGAFDKLGPTRLALASFAFHNQDGRFVPVSLLNHLRRDLVQSLEEKLRQRERRTPRPGSGRSALVRGADRKARTWYDARLSLVDQGGSDRLLRCPGRGGPGRCRGGHRGHRP